MKNELTSQVTNRQDPVCSMKAQLKATEYLQRIDPSFHLSGFSAKESGALPYCIKEFPRTNRARELKFRVFRFTCKLRVCASWNEYGKPANENNDGLLRRSKPISHVR